MRTLLLLLLAPLALAFVPQPAPFRRVPALRMSTIETPQGLRVAFDNVKRTAGLFEPGSEAAITAAAIVESLETSSFDSWQKQDLKIIDSCLVEDQSPGCSEFVEAMIELREMWDASPGNA